MCTEHCQAEENGDAMSLVIEHGPQLLQGLATTLALALAAWILALGSGLVLTLVRLSQAWPLEFAVTAFIEFQRNVPPLVHIFLWYFGVSSLLPQDLQDWANDHHGEAISAAIAIGLYYGAYFAEDIRSGLRSIAPGQMEAARALGLGRLGALRRVILPQGIRAALPALASASVMLVKTTSLAMVIGAMELTYATKDVASKTFRIFETYGISTALYVAVALCLLAAAAWLERHLRQEGH